MSANLNKESYENCGGCLVDAFVYGSIFQMKLKMDWSGLKFEKTCLDKLFLEVEFCRLRETC